jgi:flagellar protein FliO/FliZ
MSASTVQSPAEAGVSPFVEGLMTSPVIQSPEPVNMMAMYGKTAVVLLIMVGGIILLGRIARRMKLGQFGNKDSQISVLSSTSLGTKERIVVIDTGSSRLVLGVTGQSINVLDKLPPLPPVSPKSEPVSRFDALMASHAKKKTNIENSEGNA